MDKPPSASSRTAIGPTLLASIAASPLLLFMPLGAAGAWQDIAEGRVHALAWRPVIDRIAASPGIAGCETLSLCFWAGKPYAVDLFNLEQNIRTGGSIARFDEIARKHGFGVFEFAGAVSGRYGHVALKPDLLLQDLVWRGYRVTLVGPGDGVLLTPEDR